MTAASCLTVLGALSAVSWRPDLRCTTNIQQLWWQNFCSRWTSSVKLSTGPTAQSRHHLSTVSTTDEGTPFWEPWTRCSVTCDRTTFTYLLTYLQDPRPLETWRKLRCTMCLRQFFGSTTILGRSIHILFCVAASWMTVRDKKVKTHFSTFFLRVNYLSDTNLLH